MRRILFSVAMLLLAFALPATAQMQDYIIVIKDNKFSPNELNVPVGQRIKLVIKNMDTTPAEFESYDFNREKVINGNSEAIVYIGPLGSGHYTYFDDFHHDTTKGTITVK